MFYIRRILLLSALVLHSAWYENDEHDVLKIGYAKDLKKQGAIGALSVEQEKNYILLWIKKRGLSRQLVLAEDENEKAKIQTELTDVREKLQPHRKARYQKQSDLILEGNRAAIKHRMHLLEMAESRYGLQSFLIVTGDKVAKNKRKRLLEMARSLREEAGDTRQYNALAAFEDSYRAYKKVVADMQAEKSFSFYEEWIKVERMRLVDKRIEVERMRLIAEGDPIAIRHICDAMENKSMRSYIRRVSRYCVFYPNWHGHLRGMYLFEGRGLSKYKLLLRDKRELKEALALAEGVRPQTTYLHEQIRQREYSLWSAQRRLGTLSLEEEKAKQIFMMQRDLSGVRQALKPYYKARYNKQSALVLEGNRRAIRRRMRRLDIAKSRYGAQSPLILKGDRVATNKRNRLLKICARRARFCQNASCKYNDKLYRCDKRRRHIFWLQRVAAMQKQIEKEKLRLIEEGRSNSLSRDVMQ